MRQRRRNLFYIVKIIIKPHGAVRHNLKVRSVQRGFQSGGGFCRVLGLNEDMAPAFPVKLLLGKLLNHPAFVQQNIACRGPVKLA